MATNQTRSGTPSFETALNQVQAASDQFLAAARKAGTLYLDSYEKAVERAIDFERSLADSTQQEWLKGLIDTQADVARELTSSYTSAARALLK
jgi:hypothetical protein